MNKILGLIFATVVLGTAVIMLPPVKIVTDSIFDAALVSTMSPFLQAFVGAWPLYIGMGFVYGAYLLVKKG